MLFSTPQFFAFLAALLCLHYASPPAWRRWILLAASYFFYACWNPRFVPLLLTLTVIDYFAALWMDRVRPERRKLALLVSVCANLLFLGFFKYFNFLAVNAAWVLGKPRESFVLSIVLPLGISFHTLQSISYVVDVYRREQKPISNFRDYALFISFFPQLVAGPIVRARCFFRDLYNWREPSGEDVQRGILLIALGLVKKVVFADQLAQVVDPFFANVAGHPGVLTAWSAAIGFALQIYFDFSGYTDIAIGAAKLFGFHFPVNFNRPFLATSITELWRRWHISFSKWLRDYVYVPLASRRRGGEFAVYRNLMITMTVGGLWHGASWNFVIWGAYNGALLSAERWWRVRHRRSAGVATPGWLVPFQTAATFILFSMAAPLFRGRTFADAVQATRQMFSGPPGPILLPGWLIGLLVCSLALAVFEEKWQWFGRLAVAPTPVCACALAALWFCLEVFAVTDTSIPFVYFQF